MVGGFLENYNLLAILYLLCAICLIISMIKLHLEELKRFKMKKKLSDWIKFPEFKKLL